MLRIVEGADIMVDLGVVAVLLRGWMVLSADNTLELLMRRVVVCGTLICRRLSAADIGRADISLEARFQDSRIVV